MGTKVQNPRPCTHSMWATRCGWYIMSDMAFVLLCNRVGSESGTDPHPTLQLSNLAIITLHAWSIFNHRRG